MGFPTESKNEVWLAIRADGALGTGVVTDPYDASSPTLFSDRMNSFQANTTIHIGPGIFQTFGYVPGATNDWWQPKSGQKIIGAGMYATTLKVVGATVQTFLTRAIAFETFPASGPSGNLDGFEASDFTIDCNMRGHIGTRVAIGAVWAPGRRIRLRRIRAVDYGTETLPANAIECFVVSTAGAHPDLAECSDCVTEDCLIEKPYRNGTYNNTCILVDGEESSDGRTAYHRACVVRNCLINNEYQDRPAAISGITYSGAGQSFVATVTTKTPHLRSTGDWAVITGAVVGGSDDNPFNGSYQITEIDAFHFQYTMTLDPGSPPTGDMWVGKSSGHPIAIKYDPTQVSDPYNPGQPGVSISGTGPWTVTIITEKPHLRIPGQNVCIRGVTVGPLAVYSAVLNDLFPVSAWINPKKLTFIVTTDPTTQGSPNLTQNGGAQINNTSVGVTADGGAAAVVERNRIYNTDNAVYHDTYGTKDIVVRANNCFGVITGVFENMGSGTLRLATSLVSSGIVATFTTAQAHTLVVDQGIIVSNAGAPYDGRFAIAGVPRPQSFTYNMLSSASGNGNPGAQAQSLWQIGRLIVERNIVDLVLNIFQSGWGACRGLYLLGSGNAAPYVLRLVIARNNVARNVDNALDSSQLPIGIQIDSCENGIVESSLINLNNSTPCWQSTTSTILKYLNNRSPGGSLLQGYFSGSASQFLNETQPSVDLAACTLT